MISADDVLPRLAGVRPCGDGWIAPCPAHPDRRPSLSIREGDDGKLLLKCFAGCSFEAILDALGQPLLRSPVICASSPRPALDIAKRTEIARRLWRQSKPATGTLLETYLHRRGIEVPTPATLKFNPSLKHPCGPFLLPAMIAVLTDTGRNVVAIHRTYLDGQGNKTKLEPAKAALGPIAGRAVHLAPAGETLCLCEGIETGLSVLQATGTPTWVSLGAANLARVELPEITREVIIAADADDAGERAAQSAAQKFLREGRRVRIARPDAAGDFNDMRL